MPLSPQRTRGSTPPYIQVSGKARGQRECSQSLGPHHARPGKLSPGPDSWWALGQDQGQVHSLRRRGDLAPGAPGQVLAVEVPALSRSWCQAKGQSQLLAALGNRWAQGCPSPFSGVSG